MSDSTQWLGLQLFAEGKGNDALIWFKYWRPPIETLMNGSKDNYYAALQLMYPCMERVYQLEKRKVGERGLTHDVLKHFFPPGDDAIEEKYNKIISDVANYMRHGLAHDAFVREGVELWDGVVSFFSSGLSECSSRHDAVMFAGFTRPISSKVDGKIAVDVRSFWEQVKYKIDNYYTSLGYLINHYIHDDFIAMCNALIEHERSRMTDDILNRLQDLGTIERRTDENPSA